MRKIKIFAAVIFLIIVVSVILRIQFFPFGFKAYELSSNTERLEKYIVSKNIPNTSIYSYKINVKIRNKDDFIHFLMKNTEKHKEGTYLDSTKYELGSFMDSNGDINWQKVSDSVSISRMGWKKVYSLSYKTLDPGCNGYKLEVTNDGYVRDYRSAGK